MSDEKDESRLTMSVPEAGKKYFGLSRNGAYDAARRGEIPTIPVGRLLRVPIRAMEQRLDEVAATTKRRTAADEATEERAAARALPAREVSR
jgi:hypothetical protein